MRGLLHKAYSRLIFKVTICMSNLGTLNPLRPLPPGFEPDPLPHPRFWGLVLSREHPKFFPKLFWSYERDLFLKMAATTFPN